MENSNKSKTVDTSEITRISDYPLSTLKFAETDRLTDKQRLKQDALELAELIYDVFKENESNTIIGDIRKGDLNV